MGDVLGTLVLETIVVSGSDYDSALIKHESIISSIINHGINQEM